VNDDLAVETRALTKRFSRRHGWRGLFRGAGEKIALDHVDLAIRPGEIFGLLGPNGAGKTTLVKILSTLVLPSDGLALVGGLDVTRHSREVRRRIGMVYGDERTFFWRLSVRENLRFYASLYRLPGRGARRRVDDLIALVGLEDAADVPMHHFSTGMKQRAAIARGLVSDPEILFLDEPTRGLDPLAALDLRRFVRERVADGRRAVLVATHMMAEAEELCDRVAFLNQGRIQLLGTIGEIRDALQTEEAHELVVDGVGWHVLDCLRDVPGVRSVRLERLVSGRVFADLRAQRGSRAVPDAIRAIVDAGGDVWSSTPRELSLEEMFAIAVRGSSVEDQPTLEGREMTAALVR
jgi:ABC-2 type transport system ATP-binding protein